MKYDIQVLKNNNLPESLVDFLNYLETIKSTSINTIDGYRIDLTIFFRFMMIYKGKVNSDSVEFEDIDISVIDDEFLRG
ncbi:site-specific recombinase XerD [Clostridium beijerinckii]|nr:site-specific recombinase XerD [Clostridium beijerinckii]